MQSRGIVFFILTATFLRKLQILKLVYRRYLMERNGSGYVGSSQISVSTTSQEIIPSPPLSWNQGYKLYKFSFINQQDCHVIINGGSQIFLPANQGFECDEDDAPIYSFIIVESGISYNYIGAY
jgi:hypothetical protein